MVTPCVVYADTNVFIDWFQWRSGRGWIHQGEEALDFFNEVKGGEYILLTSDHLEWQLNNILQDIQPYDEYICELDSKRLHKHVTTDEADDRKAHQEAREKGTQKEDALHCVLARKGGAQLLLTQNEPDFIGFDTENFKIRRPQLRHL